MRDVHSFQKPRRDGSTVIIMIRFCDNFGMFITFSDFDRLLAGTPYNVMFHFLFNSIRLSMYRAKFYWHQANKIIVTLTLPVAQWSVVYSDSVATE